MKKILVIDVNNYIYRSFFGFDKLSTDSGIPTNALYGFAKLVLGLMRQVRPTTIVFAMDSNVNHKKAGNEDYKKGRPKTPEDLVPQFAMISEFIDLLNCYKIECVGYEADDVIASIVTQYKDQYDELYIASNDKDLLFFINHKTYAIDAKSRIVKEETIFEKYGIYANQIEDYLILIGDKIDGVAGIKGIGPKTAVKILTEYKSIKNMLANWDSVSDKIKSKIEVDALKLSTEMITTNKELEVLISTEPRYIKQSPELLEFLKRYEINSIYGLLPQ